MSSKYVTNKTYWHFFVCFVLSNNSSAAENDCPIYPHPTDCSKFYLCSPNGDALMDCPPGLHFNSQSRVCDWPKSAGCEPTTEIDNSQTENDCPIYAHPTDCTKFYLCSPNKLTLMDCPIGLHFNSRVLVCDWPQSARCVGKPTNGQTTSTAENIETDTTIYKNPMTAPNYLDTTTTGYFTNEPFFDVDQTSTSTTKSEEKTEQNKLETMSTTDNFEGHKTDTDLSTSVSDISTIFPETTSSLDEIISTATATNNQLTDSTLLPNGDLNNTFDVLCRSNLCPHPDACEKFYMASPAGNIEFTCPPDLLFDPDLLVCDFVYNVSCTNNMLTTTNKFTDIIDEVLITSTEYLSTTLDQNNPTVLTTTADDDTSSTKDVSTTTTTYNDSISTENFLDITTYQAFTTLDSSIQTTEEHNNLSQICKGTIWPHPTDCTKFLMCDATGPTERVCPKELLFNPAVLVCDWPRNVKCSQDYAISNAVTQATVDYVSTNIMDQEATTPTKYVSTTLNYDNSTIFPLYSTTIEEYITNSSTFNLTTTFNESTTTTDNLLIGTTTSEAIPPMVSTTQILQKHFNQLQLCKGSIWPHPTDCIKFMMCDSSGPTERICPKGLLFNSALLVCDWPNNVKCLGDSMISNEVTNYVTSKITENQLENPHAPQVTSSRKNLNTYKKMVEPNEICTKRKESYFLIPDPNEYRAFLICDHGFTYQSSCPKNFLFNKHLNACLRI